jgi:hypothetical protein
VIGRRPGLFYVLPVRSIRYDLTYAWANEVADGRDALLVVYHRDAVERLNRAARAVWDGLGRLSGPELEAPGGRRYRARDRGHHAFPRAQRGVDHFAARRRRRRRR